MKLNTNQEFSFMHRFLHWGIAFGILFILFTVFLRIGWMNKTHMATIIMNNTSSLTNDEAIKIAKSIRRPMFNWHVYIGYAVTALYVIRLVYLFINRKSSKIFNETNLPKDRFQKLVYIFFYIGLAIMLITGLTIEHGPKEWKSVLESIHGAGLYFMGAFIIIHLMGIVIGENSTTKGIVSKMIHGKD